MNDKPSFSGSYRSDDVTFLLQVVDQPLTDHGRKELLIQTGRFHYSELLGPEHEPSGNYLDEFRHAVNRNLHQVATDSLALASRLANAIQGRIAVVSLARAGTAVGIVATRLLRDYFGRDAVHFSVSIIAGRGLDQAAIDYVLSEPGISPSSVAFVDGWTGKGVISSALRTSIRKYNDEQSVDIDPTLHVLLDICGVSTSASSTDDYLIPHSLLGATISGLISRTFLNELTTASGRYHGCRYYADLAHADTSLEYVDAVTEIAMKKQISTTEGAPQEARNHPRLARQELTRLQEQHVGASESTIKPGLCEAVRVLLRRLPRRLIVREIDDPDVRPLIILAEEKKVPIEVDAALRWRAVSLIADVAVRR